MLLQEFHILIHILTSHKASFTGFHLLRITSTSTSKNKTAGEYILDDALQKLIFELRLQVGISESSLFLKSDYDAYMCWFASILKTFSKVLLFKLSVYIAGVLLKPTSQATFFMVYPHSTFFQSTPGGFFWVSPQPWSTEWQQEFF